MEKFEELIEKQSASEKIYDGEILHVYKDQVILPNGKEAGRELIRHIGAVCVVPITEDGMVVMEKQFRYPINQVITEIPAGKLDSYNEDRLEAAKRELLEETGYTAENWVDMGVYYPAAAYSDEKITMYLATGLKKGMQKLDDDEFLNIEQIPLKQLVDDVLDGKIEDGKTQVAIMKAKRLLEKNIRLQWLGHSCFKISAKGYTIVLDPYGEGDVPGLRGIREDACEVLCSHEHHDHNRIENVTLKKKEGSSPFTVTRLESFHDKENGNLRGNNCITILESDDFRIAHFGDIGVMPTKEQKSALKNLDAAMIPVGGFYTLEPEEVRELLEELRPRVIFPMHYRSERFGYDVIKMLDDFIVSEDKVKRYESNVFELTKDSVEQIAILKYL